MGGMTSMASLQWCEADSLSVPRQAELTEGMSRRFWLKETQVFCCRHRYSVLTDLLETLSITEKLQIPRACLRVCGCQEVYPCEYFWF